MRQRAPARTADATKAGAFALSGKLTITMSELDSLGKPFKTQAYVTVKGFDPAATDVLQFTGVVVKGASLGATVSGKLYHGRGDEDQSRPEAAGGHRVPGRFSRRGPLHRRHREQRVGSPRATR